MEKRIIDAHSHIGKDVFYPLHGNINEYSMFAESIGITDSLIMSVPCPLITINGYNIKELIWSYDEKEKKYRYHLFDTCFSNKDTFFNEPYAISNFITKIILNSCNSKINFHFVPLIHPILNSSNYLINILKQKPIAIKVHGISAGFSPQEIKEEFWNILKCYDIPLIIHTDFDISGMSSPLAILRNSNTSLSWIKILDKFQVRAFLTHGVRLCKESIKIVNNSEFFVIGIGPDSLISIEANRMMQKTEYLRTLIESVSKDKICFDLDYPWNVNKLVKNLTNTLADLDFNSIDRIKKLSLNNEELNKILSLNAAKFFQIKI